MSKIYDRLEYVGNARYIVIDIYPHKTGIRISSDNPYYFDNNDIINEDSIKYYESFDGLRLVKCDEDQKSDTEVQSDSINVSDSESESYTEVSESIDESDSTEEVNTEEVDSHKDETSSDNTSSTEEATQEEIIEYLDLNYDDESIKDVARDSGIKRILGSWDKSTIISKIIENNPQYIINLMKAQ